MGTKTRTKLYSALLSVMMLVNLVPTPTLAEGEPQPTETPIIVKTETPATEPEANTTEEPTPTPITEPTVTEEVPVIPVEGNTEPASTETPAPEQTPVSEQEETPVPEQIPAPEQEEKQDEESKETEADFEENKEESEEAAEKSEDEDEVSEEETEDEEEVSYPAVTLSETVEGVTVTLSAPEGSLPEGVHMTVEPVHEKAIFEAVDGTLAEEGRELASAVAFDITLYDAKENELQPNKYVTVSFSNTNLSSIGDNSTIDVYRVSDDASEVTPVTTIAATDNNQMFITDHFTIYVSGNGSPSDPNGYGNNQINARNNPYYLEYNETVTLASDKHNEHWDWIADEKWYVFSSFNWGAIKQEGDNSPTFRNTNTTNQNIESIVAHTWIVDFWGNRNTEWFVIVSKRSKCDVTFKVKYLDNEGNPQTDFQQLGDIKSTEKGSSIRVAVPNPVKQVINGVTYKFTGWCWDEACENPINPEYFMRVDKTFTTYGTYRPVEGEYALNYHGNGEGANDPYPQISTQNTIQIREEPTRPGYRLIGYATEPTGEVMYHKYDNVEFTNGQKVIELYAIWEEKDANIYYGRKDGQYTWGNRNPTSEHVKAINGTPQGSTASPNSGYRFVKWVDSDGNIVGTNQYFTPSKTSNGIYEYYADADYYAVFEPITHTVTFNTNGGTVVDSQFVNQGSVATKPAAPTKDNCHSFGGWYSDQALTKAYDFSTPVTESITLYAKWNVNHERLANVEAIPATCTNPGSIEYWYCSTCESYYSDAALQNEISPDDILTPALGHNPASSITIIKSPTCTEDGSHKETVYCTREGCDETLYERTIDDPALGHTWGQWTDAPTETVPNQKKRECSVCHEVETKSITPGHTHEIVEVPRKAPGCTTQGKELHYKCSLCDKLFSDLEGHDEITAPTGIPAEGHSTEYVYVTVSKIVASCTQPGREIRLKKCNKCNAILAIEAIDTEKLGHSWSEMWEASNSPTCTESGLVEKHCQREGCTETQTIKIPPLGHDWGAWVIVKAPTTSEKGLKERTCKHDATHKQTEEIPVLTPAPSNITPAVTPLPLIYHIVEGADASYAKNSWNPLSFTYKRTYEDEVTFSHFTGLEVDGIWLGSSLYTAVAGSVVITLNADYLESLEIGKHTITAYFDDGNAVTSDFYVGTPRTNRTPNTEDDNRIPMWALIEFYSITLSLIIIHKLRTMS